MYFQETLNSFFSPSSLEFSSPSLYVSIFLYFKHFLSFTNSTKLTSSTRKLSSKSSLEKEVRKFTPYDEFGRLSRENKLYCDKEKTLGQFKDESVYNAVKKINERQGKKSSDRLITEDGRVRKLAAH